MRRYTLLIVYLASATTVAAVSWLAGITYDQNDDSVSLDTTGDEPPKAAIADSPSDVIALILYDTRVRPEKYSMSPDDGVVTRIKAEEVIESRQWQVRVTIELGGEFPYDIGSSTVGEGQSTLRIKLTGVNVERRLLDLDNKVPVWARPGPDSLIGDFLEYGAKPKLLDYDGGYFLVQMEDGYTGWVEEKYVKLPGEGKNPFTDPRSNINMSDVRKDIIATARGYIGTPYLWGGTTGDGFDCSGFVQTVFAENDIELPRGSGDQFRDGWKIEKDRMLPGDLIFFHTYTSGPSHVGIWLGDGRFIHAESSPAGVTITPLATIPYWNSRYHGSRRWVDDFE
ncbi:MAG: C40 family peptidase [bacterium]|nr:C40 family peptidase [bacterium]